MRASKSRGAGGAVDTGWVMCGGDVGVAGISGVFGWIIICFLSTIDSALTCFGIGASGRCCCGSLAAAVHCVLTSGLSWIDGDDATDRRGEFAHEPPAVALEGLLTQTAAVAVPHTAAAAVAAGIVAAAPTGM